MAAISDKGGNKIVIAQLLATNFAALSSYTAGTNCLDLGEINTSGHLQENSSTEYKNNAGKSVAMEEEWTLRTNATLMERDKTLVDFLAHSVKGNFYLEYQHLGIVEGNYHEILKIVRIPAQTNITVPGAATSNQYNSVGVYPQSTIIFSTTQIATIMTAVGVTVNFATQVSISSAQGYHLIATAVA